MQPTPKRATIATYEQGHTVHVYTDLDGCTHARFLFFRFAQQARALSRFTDVPAPLRTPASANNATVKFDGRSPIAVCSGLRGTNCSYYAILSHERRLTQ